MHRREISMSEISCYPQRRRTPSFSSNLLDTICRSIDQSKTDLDEDTQMGLYNETTHHTPFKEVHFSYNNRSLSSSKKQQGGKDQRMNLRQAVMMEDWMENQKSSHNSPHFTNSSSSSSECCSRVMFSSSEIDTSYDKQRSRTKTHEKQHHAKKAQQEEGGFARTKLRALKMYDELNQRVLKQPISPGSRIATFLSSIFNSENVKKAKMCYVGAAKDVNFEHKSKSPPCFSNSSSASSFSRRSCMSEKTPSSAKGKNSSSSNGSVKRSMRFYPVSIILGEEDSNQPSDPSLLPLSNVRKITRNSSIKESKKNIVKAKKNGAEAAALKFDFRSFYENGEDDVDEEDDVLSCSSSDLFELDHLIGGAAGRYQEELPVYETTNLETNKAISNGMRL